MESVSTNVETFVNTVIHKYDIKDVKDHQCLYDMIKFSKPVKKNENNFNLLISLYDEKNIKRAMELLYCLKENYLVESIGSYYILLEKSENSEYFIKRILNFFSHGNENVKISTISQRPTFNSMFRFANEYIKGVVIMANSDIIFDETLHVLTKMKRDHFITLTRYNHDGKLIKSVGKGTINIFSQDTWIFHSPMTFSLNNCMDVGTFYSDSFMNYVLSRSNYKCFNLGKYIVSKHIQNDESSSQHLDKFPGKKKEMVSYLKKTISDFDLAGIEMNHVNDFLENKNYNHFRKW
jgi:hypothetical protein